MDVTFVLEESGATATVEVPCDANVAEAKRVACTEFAVSPASVEVRVGTEVVEGTCRLQDTAIGTGVQVVLACPAHADVRCPAEYTLPESTARFEYTLSCCGTLCVILHHSTSGVSYLSGFDTEAFDTAAFTFEVDAAEYSRPAISRCKTRCYLRSRNGFDGVALPSGEVLCSVTGTSKAIFVHGRVVVSQCKDSVSVYDEDLTLLRSIAHNGCAEVILSHCGGWLMTSSRMENSVRLWDVNTGLAVASVPGTHSDTIALSPHASALVVYDGRVVRLYDHSGAALHSCNAFAIEMQFTPCGKYLVVEKMCTTLSDGAATYHLYQYEVATMACVYVIPDSRISCSSASFVISPCSRVIMFEPYTNDDNVAHCITTRHLHPYNIESMS